MKKTYIFLKLTLCGLDLFTPDRPDPKIFKSIIVDKKNENELELLIPNICFVEFDFLAFKKTEGSEVLHDILKCYSNGFCDKAGFYYYEAD